MKLLVNEAKLSCLGARNCAFFQQVLSLKFAFGLEKLPGPFEKRAPGQIEEICHIFLYILITKYHQSNASFKETQQVPLVVATCLPHSNSLLYVHNLSMPLLLYHSPLQSVLFCSLLNK